MLQSAKIRYIFPIGLFLAFFLDGIIALDFAKYFFSYPYSMVSNLIISWFVLAIFFEGNSKINFTMWSIIIGIAFDWFYTGIFGIDMFLIPLIVMLVRNLKLFGRPSFLWILGVNTIALSVYNLIFYFVFHWLKFANVSTLFFLGYSFVPTLILNLSIFVVLYYPIKQLFKRTRGTNLRSFE